VNIQLGLQSKAQRVFPAKEKDPFPKKNIFCAVIVPPWKRAEDQ
jgi:hypothetical protein